MKFSGASWKKDGSGFFYSRYDAPASADQLKQANYYHKLYFHKLGTPQSQDTWSTSARITRNGLQRPRHRGRPLPHHRRLIRAPTQRTASSTKTLRKPDAPVVELLNKLDAAYDFLGCEGTPSGSEPTWTRREAGSSRSTSQKPENITTVVPEAADKLEAVELVGDRFIASYLKDAHCASGCSMSGKFAGEIKLPGSGTASGFGANAKTREFHSYSASPRRRPFTAMISRPAKVRALPPESRFRVRRLHDQQVFYHSKDGTPVPMFIRIRKAWRKTATTRQCFTAMAASQFRDALVLSASLDGNGRSLCRCQLRGGGEYGKEWHQAGTKGRNRMCSTISSPPPSG